MANQSLKETPKLKVIHKLKYKVKINNQNKNSKIDN